VQRISHGIPIGDGWNGACVESRIEQRPGMAGAAEEIRGWGNDAWIARLVEVEATGVVARPDAKRNEPEAVDERQIQSGAAGCRVGIVDQGQAESAIRVKPPVAEDSPSRRKASRETMVNVAEAIRAMQRMLRPGR